MGLVWEGALPDRVLISGESLERSLPWSAALSPQPAHNRFVGDQPRIYYPYLLEAAKVYSGRSDALWTSRGGGGLPFLGNMTSSLFHPLTALAAVLPVELVPWVQAVAVLSLSAWFTFLFLRRLGVRVAPALVGGVAVGFGGHQVLWLQYALSHVLLALPLCFWSIERVVGDRSGRRVVIMALAFALLVFGGHPETSLVCGAVAGLWALYRLWDSHGRSLVVGAAVLAVGLSAVQWWPFLDYALSDSHGLFLRQLEASRAPSGVRWSAAFVYGFFILMALAALRSAAERGLVRRVLAVGLGAFALVMARRMGMAISGGVLMLPDLYGSPVGAGTFTGAQDYPGLNAGFAGVLPPMLLAVGAVVGLGGGFVRFFAIASVLLWGAAFKMPGAEGLVRALPGFAEVGPTRLLGPVGFMTACGGALVLDILTTAAVKPGFLKAAARVTLTLGAVVAVGYAVLSMQVDPHGGRTLVKGVLEPDHTVEHTGDQPIEIRFELKEAVDELRVMVDRRLLLPVSPHGPTGAEPISVRYDAQRAEEGRHRLMIETVKDGVTTVMADEPLSIRRPRHVSPRDRLFVVLSLVLLAWFFSGPRVSGPWIALLVVAADVLSFGAGYNTATRAERLYPPTETVAFLRAQPGPFRIFTEGTILPPDTGFVEGIDHILSYDNIGYHRTWQWLSHSGVTMDHFATFSFSRENVEYGHRRFDALDVAFVLTAPEVDLSDIPGMQLVHESECRVWRNTDNLGRAWVVGEAMVLERDDPRALERTHPGAVALLEVVPDFPLGGRGTATLVAHEGSRIVVDVACEGPGLLVLAENRADGWTASVDGGPALPTLRADVAWQAVPVPDGTHQVEFRYEPAAFWWGSRISILAAVIALIVLFRPRRFR